MLVGIVCLPFLAWGRYFNFSTPEVAKVDWNTRELSVYDVNGDGANDLLLINNDKAKIEILYRRTKGGPALPKTVYRNRWQPVLEDAHFEHHSIISGGITYAVAAGDLNGDGRTDITYTTKQTPSLTVGYQDENGLWLEKFTFSDLDPLPWISTLAITDFNSDKRDDLIVLGKGKLLLFSQNTEGRLQEPKVFLNTEGNAYGLQVRDLNRDSLYDLLYLDENPGRSLRIRQQYPSGLGPELGFSLDDCLYRCLSPAYARGAGALCLY